MPVPDFTMRQLMEAGVHFGHRVHLWEPKVAPYLYGARSGIHIIDLSQTVPLLRTALGVVCKTAAEGGRILFVGTKRQACYNIAEAATRCAQYYMNHRWLGGTLTNWGTVSKSIRRLRDLDELLENADDSGLTKKELLHLTRERDKYQRTLGGIRNMGGLPNLVFVVDTHREAIAIREARKLGIPIIAIIDSNCDPDDADYPIPGNDDASRSVKLYCDLISDAVLEGLGNTAAEMPREEAPEAVEAEPAKGEAAKPAKGEASEPAKGAAAEPAKSEAAKPAKGEASKPAKSDTAAPQEDKP